MNDEALNQRANQRAAKRKELQDKEVASKRKRGGILIVYTGAGKGKSTAAFGLVTRALGHGMKVAVVQFTKGKWKTGERNFFEKIAHDNLVFYSMGQGFTWETQDRAQDIEFARRAWQKVLDLIKEAQTSPPAWDMIILDELNHIIRYGYLEEEDVIKALENRPSHLHIVVTGRSASKRLMALAQTVTEMKLVSHAYGAGYKAQKGIEF